MPDLGVTKATRAPSPGSPQDRRRIAAAAADFDPRWRWMVVAVSGLFGLSVLMTGLLVVDSSGMDGLVPGVAQVAPSPVPQAVPAPPPPPRVVTSAPAGPRQAKNKTRRSTDRSRQSVDKGKQYAREVAAPWLRFVPNIRHYSPKSQWRSIRPR